MENTTEHQTLGGEEQRAPEPARGFPRVAAASIVTTDRTSKSSGEGPASERGSHTISSFPQDFASVGYSRSQFVSEIDKRSINVLTVHSLKLH